MSRKLRQDLHTLAGAYALNALRDEELRRFEQHLLHCDACVQEVRGMTETTALLGSAAARTPPPEMRAAVLDEVARTRQLAPAPPQPFVVTRSRWWQRGLVVVLAACLAALIALGAVVVDQRREISELRSEEQQIAAVMSAPDAEYVSAEPSEGVSVTAVASESMGSLVFTGQGLSQLDDQDYQVWLAAPDGSVRSAGLLTVGADGAVEPLLAEQLADAQTLAVTIEPAGGSPQPTSDPMMSMSIES
ncbi:anti-sigma factor [Salinactinospora qingdaonensis]|uniref:anti-sigma factor n=1 Tax=Salinactinospora qingdaonensis TaxID=702744 RepID=UPI0031EBF8D4